MTFFILTDVNFDLGLIEPQIILLTGVSELKFIFAQSQMLGQQQSRFAEYGSQRSVVSWYCGVKLFMGVTV